MKNLKNKFHIFRTYVKYIRKDVMFVIVTYPKSANDQERYG